MHKSVEERIAMWGRVGRYDNVAEPFHCDVAHRLFMGHLGNHLLNAADFHSSDRGFGMKYLNTVNKTWVLSRLVIEMTDMPKQYEKFSVETWVESAIRYFTNRNFRVESQDGRSIGYGRSIWALIDTETRQPCNLMDIRDGEIEYWAESKKECPIDKPGRVKMSKCVPMDMELVAKYSDIDVNGHVNSVKYIEHVLDLFPLDIYQNKFLSRFEIAYVAECHAGDILRFYKEQMSENEYEVRIAKVVQADDGNATETECVRSSVKFIDKNK
ncbi:MAG: thioesterase [Bacteroidales bacterium]|nr:thioesterase [Bacteroidales bacterium]MCM1147588.1 thioesterase [Bacteroidales bacterium]MCM1206378.1 thioesterase [Bacillota bacterium]MCM1509112.1 thioesterase [Clostridium sp.]